MTTLRWLLVLGLAGAATHAHADPPTTTATDEDSNKARSFFEKGMGRFQLEEYDAAIEMWEAGFRLKPVPEFLYNIGQAYRQSKRPEKAIAFYKKYLRLAPNAKNRAEVERHIAALQIVVDEQQRSASAPPQDPVMPGRTSPGEPADAHPTTTTTNPPMTTPSTPGTTHADLTASAPVKKPITRRAWFWPVVGGGAAIVVAAVVVGVVVGTSGDSAKGLPGLRF